MWRSGFALFACAFTVAIGLPRAEEMANPPSAAPEPAAQSSGAEGKGAPHDSTGTNEKGSTGWTGGSRDQTNSEPGVGSRALVGQPAQDRGADQPAMATGVDLKGPPQRFPAADTPE